MFLKEVERPKHLPGEIVSLMQDEGYPKFTMHQHTQLWKELDARNPGKGYGALVSKTWYWYDRWVERVREHCSSNAQRFGATEWFPWQRLLHKPHFRHSWRDRESRPVRLASLMGARFQRPLERRTWGDTGFMQQP